MSSHIARRGGIGLKARTVVLGVLVTLVSGAHLSPASAESITGIIESDTYMCVDTVQGFGSDPDWLFSVAGNCVLNNAATATWSKVRDDTVREISNEIEMASSTPVGIVEALLGEATAQVERLSGLRAQIDADITRASIGVGLTNGNLNIYQGVGGMSTVECVESRINGGGCFGVQGSSSASGSDGGDSISGLNHHSTWRLYWTRGKGRRLDGIYIFNIYIAGSKYRPEFDYYATSIKTSVSPDSGTSIRQVLAQARSKGNLEPVEYSPNVVRSYPGGGSLTLGASLSGEYKVGGGVGISKTWDFSKEKAGGGMRSNHQQHTFWAGKESFTQGTAGVATWKTHAGSNAQWALDATGWWCEC